MKKLLMLAAAVGALASVQTIGATPAEARGGCGNYYRTAACCPRYYRTVRQYRPIYRKAVKKVTYYRIVGYRAVKVRRHYRPCCR